MAFTRTTAISLGAGQTGLTLSAQLIDTTGSSVGSAVTSGFVEIGLGNYIWTYASFPDGHRGAVKFSASSTLKAIVAINPEGDAENTNVKSSTLSTYAGGPVASVTGNVGGNVVGSVGSVVGNVGGNVVGSVGSVGSGVVLAAAGLDSVVVEAGMNARQALSPIAAASAGLLSGAGTGTITIKGAGVSTTRILATTDDSGNRTAITLTLPS